MPAAKKIDAKYPNTLTLIGLSIFILASLCFLYEFFLRTFLGSIVTELSKDLHLNATQLSLVDAAYYIIYGIMQIPVGILIDKYGTRILLSVATIICSLGVFCFSIAHGFYLAFLGRILIGFGSSFAFISLLTLSLNWLPQKHSGFFFGFAQFLGAIGPMLAGVPLILLLNKCHDDWRFVLVNIGAIGLILSILIAVVIRNKPSHNRTTIILLHCRESLITQLNKLLTNKQAWFIAIYSATVYTSIALLGTLWGPTYLATKGLPQTTATFITSMLWFGLAFGCPLLGAISDLIKRRKIVLAICAILGIVITILIILLTTTNKWVFMALFFGLGIAGAGQSVGFNTIAERVECNLNASALGFNNGMISFSNTCIIPIIGFMIQLSFHGHFVAGETIYHKENFILGLSVMPILYIIAFFIAIFAVQETFCCQQNAALSPSSNNNFSFSKVA